MEPRELIRNWVSAFNRADSKAMAELYAKDAVNHQVIWKPLVGRDAIQEMFEREFRRATMVCQIENIFQDGDWAILEWSDPKGLLAQPREVLEVIRRAAAAVARA
jgi:uncharacterized protein (TIGR02246 family)